VRGPLRDGNPEPPIRRGDEGDDAEGDAERRDAPALFGRACKGGRGSGEGEGG